MSNKQVELMTSRAMAIAKSFHHEYVIATHVLRSLLDEEEICSMLTDLGVNPQDVVETVDGELKNNCNDIYNPSYTGLIKRSKSISDILQRSLTSVALSAASELTVDTILVSILSDTELRACYILNVHGITVEAVKDYLQAERKEDKKSALDTYCKNLNDAAKDGDIDPVIGRETEITDIIQVLAHRKKNNTLLVGEPGVGKTAIAEGLARKIHLGDVPDSIKDRVVYSMDIGVMLAGTKFRGDFEERMKTVLNEIVERGDVILFIDEIHMIMGAGSSNSGSVDASNLLKPLLAKGKLMCIGATTFDESAKHIENDRALMRRFQKIAISEPSIDDAKRILAGVEAHYAEFHGVTYAPGALDLAVDLSARYMRNKFLPDKAFDVIDFSGAFAKLNKHPVVTTEMIIQSVCKLANVSEKIINVKEDNVVSVLDVKLKSKVFNQDTAIDTVTDAIQLAKAGLRDPNKPLANLLFVGPTGTGKTHICKNLARIMSVELVRFDMSEYQERHSLSKLIGAPPGYVGHGEGQNGEGALIAAIEKNPDCVLLLDEIEKAHPDVYNILLQIMDDARLTSSKGKTVDFSNTILVMTSNAGARDAEKRTIGFSAEDYTDDAIDSEVKKMFSPEFRNRLDAIVKFNRLNKKSMFSIVAEQTKELNSMLAKKEISVVLTEDAVAHLADKGYDPSMGARPLKRLFEQEIKRPLSKMILKAEIKAGETLLVDYVAGNIVVTKSEHAESEVTV